MRMDSRCGNAQCNVLEANVTGHMMPKKEEDENEKQRQLVIERKKAADRVRTAVMALIEVKRAQAKEGSRKGKGTKNRPWETTLSVQALELVKIEVLVNRAREAGVDEVELQLALQACGPHGW